MNRVNRPPAWACILCDRLPCIPAASSSLFPLQAGATPDRSHTAPEDTIDRPGNRDRDVVSPAVSDSYVRRSFQHHVSGQTPDGIGIQ